MTVAEAPLTPVPAPPSSPIASQPWFARLARFSGRRRRVVMLVWLAVVIVAAPLALTLSSSLSGAGWEAQGSTAQKVRDELRRDFPDAGAEAAVVAYHQAVPIAQDRAGLQALVTSLQGAPGAASVVDPLSLPPEAGMISPDDVNLFTFVETAEEAWRVLDAEYGFEAQAMEKGEYAGEV